MTTAETATVKSERRDGYHIVTLNRPDKLNSFNVQQHADLKSALDLAEADETCRAVILTGAGRGFCAGQDLSDRSVTAKSGETPNLNDTLGLHYNPLIRRLAAFPVPVICAVNGIAAGAGANIALACDIVIAAKSAKFLQAFAKIGLMPDAGGTWTLPRLVGPARARALAMLAEPVDAVTAESWGMIYKVFDDANLIPAAEAMAQKFAQSSTTALVTIREALSKAETNTLDQQLEVERTLQQRLATAPDYAEGVTAFFEKRAPKFSGRR
jgi:2-(1,2-epoxy-1,2-dihydrophenyl)acetyl-CoA isomerase